MMLDPLVKTALVGTSRAAAVELPPGPAADAVAGMPAADPESRLLNAVAVLSQYEACGRTPIVADLPPAAAPDARPACSPRAADLLGRVLAMPQTDERKQLVREWLAHANAAGRRLPHALLPVMLDYAVKLKEARPAVTAVADARGAWLMGLNPQWRIGAAADEDPAAVWGVGTFDQRLSALHRLRAADPRAAVELIRSTWTEDAADHRQAFVSALLVGLTPDDEPFLESALDDRSKAVRTAAADLLARLPGSAFVRRMTARATAMLSFTPAGKGGLLRKGTPAAVTVTLPAAYDPSWERDGVAEKGVAGSGHRQGWLSQVVSAVPPQHWSAAWGVTAAEAIAAVPPEFADVVVAAWAESAVRHPTAEWASALLAGTTRYARGRARFDMLDALPKADRLAVTRDVLRSPGVSAGLGQAVLAETSFPLDRSTADAAVMAVERYIRTRAGEPDYYTGSMLLGLSLRIPPDLYDELADRWAGTDWGSVRTAFDTCLATLKLRRDIQREFAS